MSCQKVREAVRPELATMDQLMLKSSGVNFPSYSTIGICSRTPEGSCDKSG